MSRVYSLRSKQTIPVDINTAWQFFSNPANLQTITPATLGFKVISKHQGNHMYAGQIIEYRVSPILNIPLYWMTEITHVKDKQFFVDEQRYGPYSLWHHQHHFYSAPEGVNMVDIVHYKIPFWFLGDIAHILFVKQQLKRIFEHRYRSIIQKFGTCPDNKCDIQFY